MKKSLNQAIKDKVSQHELSSNQLANLQKMVDESVTPTEKPAPNYRQFALAAMICLTVLFTALLIPRPDTVQKESIVQLIANEVVKNHLKQKPLEIHSNSITSLQHYFTQLDFLLVQSNQISDFSNNLIGGRYCSIQGITAAQLRLKNTSSTTPNTLYQTEYRKDVFGPMPDISKGEKPIIAWAKGIKVKLWVEKGLLFALTESGQKH
ncbi:MAG: hypothetical protein OEY00_13660 [Gammaproteobacteria bacterium]|nr:hypothetical protein [Gammaproteobacteria bacterium]